jgi:hypothetical protein
MGVGRFRYVSSLRFNPEAGVHALWLNLWALIAGFFMAGDRGSAVMAGPSMLKVAPLSNRCSCARAGCI